jgi:HlyD family secretion protein
MSLDDLIKKSSDSSSAGTPYSKRKRSFAWLLPVGLLLGFLIILGLLFGGRLLPATSVKTAPVITIRAGESLSLRGGGNSLVNDTKPSGKGSLLFQASGWVEPDPYTVFVPTLINGVVDEVHALEGQSIKKGDLVATLVDDEARLDFQSAQQKYTRLEKKIVAHCTGPHRASRN